MVLNEETQAYETRQDALYRFGDALMEAFVSGRGPLGPIGVFGLWFGILVRLCLKRQSCVNLRTAVYSNIFFQKRVVHNKIPPRP